jgi:L-threonylcarbamoyladenylate synthase
MIIYRPGAVTIDQIREIAGEVEVFQPLHPQLVPESLPSPGVGIRHYAPKARLILIEAPLADLLRQLLAAFALHTTGKVGLMLPLELSAAALSEAIPPGAIIFRWGRFAAPDELAHNLYAGLRSLDIQNCSVILCPVPPAEGIGAAIRDRLRKAAWASETEAPGASGGLRNDA